MAQRSINPATLEIISETEELSVAELESKLATAASAYRAWRLTSFSERAAFMRKAAMQLRTESASLARLITTEVGKTLKASEIEVQKSATVCDFYADHAETFLADELIATEAPESFVRFEPLGVVLAVMPWNFPLWQVFRFAAPALMAGNVGVLKHASNVQGCARAIESIFAGAGFPAGVFTNLALGSSRIRTVIEDARIAAVTLTGSEKAGSDVASIAGKSIKKTVLELGGSDPFIVLPDADIEKAVAIAVLARMQSNAGQSCISAKRFIVHKDVVDTFSTLLTEAVGKLSVGDPLLESTDVGPLATEQMQIDAQRQVRESIEKGATLLCGGKKLEKSGYFYLPTVLSNVTKGMPVYDEEIFGPVLPIIEFESDAEAVRIANDTPYGLGATIFSRDSARAKKMAREIESGSVFINAQVKSDARLPFGGVKKSGYGRELSSYGIKEFVNVKTVVVNS